MFEQLKKHLPEEENMDFIPVVTEEDVPELQDSEVKDVIPILPLRNTILFPGLVLPITVGRDKSLNAINEAYKTDKVIGILAQHDSSIDDPQPTDLYKIGTVAKIIKMLKMPDGSNTVIIQGRRRFNLKEIISTEPFMSARIELVKEEEVKTDKEFNATISSLKDLSNEVIRLSPQIPSEAAIVIKNISNPNFLTHFIAANLQIDVPRKQEILELQNLKERAERVLKYLQEELQMLELKTQIQDKVRGDIEKQQRDYFLHQQMKKIQEELGGDGQGKELQLLREKAEKINFPKHVKEVFDKELLKLERTNPAAAEYSVTLNYLELLLDLPWTQSTSDNFDLKRARKVLDRDHKGLDKVKDRILEYLAVLKLKGDLKSPILCLVGPPGVGKTSLGRSIADSLGRKYVRMSLGGLHDEAEIRGHRKTYIGAMPGRVIQSIKKAKSSNPVFILDEVDKIGNDFRGDPSSALLEVLDPEQNATFYDNYLELEYDLSKVMFIATANNLASIQPALRDRMEIIFVDGYSTEEKMEIASSHLVKKQREAHGIKAKDVKFTDETLRLLIEDYTRESGVRELDRVLAAVMRNLARKIVLKEKYEPKLSKEEIGKILGHAKFDKEKYHEDLPAGVAIGLAYTPVGGDILYIEASLSKGKGGLQLTGNLGDVMKESASTAMSFVRSHAHELEIDEERFDTTNVHVHVPEGATPKDGPSAGITMLSALTSAFSGRKIKPYTAFTGEITLRGKVLPVGGIKEKVLAAKRAGMKNIVMCKDNEKDVEEINQAYIKGIKFIYVSNMAQVLKEALI